MQTRITASKFEYIRTLISISTAIRKQKRVSNQTLKELLAQSEERWSGEQLPKSIHYRLFNYAGLIAGFFGEAVCAFHGEKLDPLMRRSLMLVGGCSPLFDSFFDEYKHKVFRLRAILSSPTAFTPNDIHEDLFQQLYCNLLQQISSDRLSEYLNRLYETERKGNLLEGEALSSEVAHQLCAEKGGIGALIFRVAIPIPFAEGEEEALFAFGTFVQYVDDLFDLRIDLTEGNRTPLSLCCCWKEVENLLDKQYLNACQLVERVDVREKQRQRFIFRGELYYRMAKYYLEQLKEISPESVQQIGTLEKSTVDFDPDWRLIFRLA